MESFGRLYDTGYTSLEFHANVEVKEDDKVRLCNGICYAMYEDWSLSKLGIGDYLNVIFTENVSGLTFYGVLEITEKVYDAIKDALPVVDDYPKE